MADTRFLSNLQNFPKDKINAETVDLMLPYVENAIYTYENAKVACGNVAGLLQWTTAMRSFYNVNKDVLPLKVCFKTVIYIFCDKNKFFTLKDFCTFINH